MEILKKSIRKFLLIGLLVLIVITGFVYYVFLSKGVQKKSKATGENVTLFFDPSTVTAPSGEFNVTIKAKPSIDMVIRGYVFTLQFDKTKLQARSITYKLGTVSSGIGDDTAKLTTINSTGLINVQGEIQNATGQPLLASANTDVVTIAFTADSSTDYSTSVVLKDSSTKIFSMIAADYSLLEIPVTLSTPFWFNSRAGATNTPVPTNTSIPTPTATVPPGQPTNTPIPTATGIPVDKITLNLKLKFQGINRKPVDALNKMKVAVKVKAQNSPLSKDFVTDFVADDKGDDKGVWTGKLEMSAFPPDAGYFYLLVKGPKHLQKKICDTKPTETTEGTYRCSAGRIKLVPGENDLNFSGIRLLAGDLPQDADGYQNGVVDAYDLSLVRNNLGKSDADSLKQSDINLDGAVNAMDFSLMINSLSVKYDEEGESTQ